MNHLYHYTCDHGRNAIGAHGVLTTTHSRLTRDERAASPWTAMLVWLTDLDVPVRDALGLTSHMLSCDRTTHRYRVTDATKVLRWADVRRAIAPDYLELLESTPGAMPMHWWVSTDPVPVVLDSAGAR